MKVIVQDAVKIADAVGKARQLYKALEEEGLTVGLVNDPASENEEYVPVLIVKTSQDGGSLPAVGVGVTVEDKPRLLSW